MPVVPNHAWYCRRCEPHSTVRSTKVVRCIAASPHRRTAAFPHLTRLCLGLRSACFLPYQRCCLCPGRLGAVKRTTREERASASLPHPPVPLGAGDNQPFRFACSRVCACGLRPVEPPGHLPGHGCARTCRCDRRAGREAHHGARWLLAPTNLLTAPARLALPLPPPTTQAGQPCCYCVLGPDASTGAHITCSNPSCSKTFHAAW